MHKTNEENKIADKSSTAMYVCQYELLHYSRHPMSKMTGMTKNEINDGNASFIMMSVKKNSELVLKNQLMAI